MSTLLSVAAALSASLLTVFAVNSDYNGAVAAENQAQTQKSGAPWNPARSDNWVATDGLGRALPTFEEVGPTRPGKFVAAFYFLWNGRHGENGPYDITKILAQFPQAKDDPNFPRWGAPYDPHHWGESIFGYYVGEDESVLRKHAQMLGDAGVDVICFDVTNQLTYPESYRPLFKVFSEMQKAGNKVPKVAFLCPFWAPNKVVRELWRDVYSQDFYSDVWFYWKGKPLILADPDMIGGSSSALATANSTPIELRDGDVFSQRFSTEKEFRQLRFVCPTWEQKNCAVDVVLRDESGAVVKRFDAVPVADNLPIVLRFETTLPAGKYALETSNPVGKVGWWARTFDAGSSDANDYSEKYANGAASVLSSAPGVRWLGATQNGKPTNAVFLTEIVALDDDVAEMLNFFTFRAPMPDYFIGPQKANQWGWLEAFPQHEFYAADGKTEQMCVGVAQNAVDGKLGVLSNPRAYGRSFHNGAEPAPEDCDFTGRNFQEQWNRALEIDPEMIFVTGWNEWIAGRFDINAPFHGATPVSFVDQFNMEFSRDCEPVKGGHGDAYYYQMISNIRRFKGVSKPESAKTAPIEIDGEFADWADVAPRFFDEKSDETRRDSRGWGVGSRYVNATGRNDFVETRVSFDAQNVYFYVETRNDFIGDPSVENWARLLLDVDENVATGCNGADFVVFSDPFEPKKLALTKTTANGIDVVAPTVPIEYRLSGKKLELAIPRAALGFAESVAPIRFKWADGIDVFGDWSGFTANGDAAPNDRYFYRYVPNN